MDEALARRRCAELFANARITPDHLWGNVWPLSGAPANHAVYKALVDIGDTVMGLSQVHGGHLSHGGPVTRSGRHYQIVPYWVNLEIERLDYGETAKTVTVPAGWVPVEKRRRRWRQTPGGGRLDQRRWSR